jgi:serine protease Do
MEDERDPHPPAGATALEHLTGPSRGAVTWLSGPILDVSLKSDRFIRISEARPDDPPEGLISRLHRADGSYVIEAVEGRPIWVNGARITAQELEHRDMIEFGDTGPFSRFRLYREDRPVRKMVGDILSDGLVYLRVSRQPFAHRLYRALYGFLGRLMLETTLLFRVGVILAITALAVLTYQQNRLDVLLQQQIERDTTLLESFAGALARAREEALTPGDLQTLRQDIGHRLTSNAERLALLEHRSQASARVIAESMAAVVFLQGAYGFRENSSGRMLRHVVDHDGRPLISPIGQPLLSLEGDGPVAERQLTGTGFAVGGSGALITARHVALPWENYANVEALADQGLTPVMVRFIVYAPGKEAADAVELVRASDEVDLAILRSVDSASPMPGLKLADTPPALGDEIIVMGYPTGLRTMLAQSGEGFVKELQEAEDIDFWSVAARLAKKGHIAPLASRGIVSQASLVTIVYDAETTHGGSGGPVLDIHGSVVAVNAAILPDFGGSNLGIPAAQVRALLEQAGLR